MINSNENNGYFWEQFGQNWSKEWPTVLTKNLIKTWSKHGQNTISNHF